MQRRVDTPMLLHSGNNTHSAWSPLKRATNIPPITSTTYRRVQAQQLKEYFIVNCNTAGFIVQFSISLKYG